MEDCSRHLLSKNMNKPEFKKIFGKAATHNGLVRAYGGWFQESCECIVVLDLQTSNYSNLLYLNIKVFLRGGFPDYYGDIEVNRDLVKKHVGDVFTRPPERYNDLFDLENTITDFERSSLIDRLFADYLVELIESALSRNGLKYLAKKGEILLTEPVAKEIDRLDRVSQNWN